MICLYFIGKTTNKANRYDLIALNKSNLKTTYPIIKIRFSYWLNRRAGSIRFIMFTLKLFASTNIFPILPSFNLFTLILTSRRSSDASKNTINGLINFLLNLQCLSRSTLTRFRICANLRHNDTLTARTKNSSKMVPQLFTFKILSIFYILIWICSPHFSDDFNPIFNFCFEQRFSVKSPNIKNIVVKFVSFFLTVACLLLKTTHNSGHITGTFIVWKINFSK